MLKSKNCTRIKVPKGAVLQGFWALLFAQNMKTTYKESDQWGFTN